jgi:Tfp pilus assembly protein PilX
MIKRPFQRPAGRRGQVMILLVVFMVILVLIGLWNFDLHKIVRVKTVARNGGDAAALAAARWQALTLNLIGELNIVQAAAWTDALTAGQSNACPAAEACADLQARLCMTGPLLGLSASQQAAKNNGIFVNSGYTRSLSDHAALVRAEYDIRFPDPPYDNGPGEPSCWIDYANMLDILASEGIAAAPDSFRYYIDFATRDHYLLNPDFYSAVATRSWCWFFFNAMALLETYNSYQDWPGLPLITEPRPLNSEFFGLYLRRQTRLDGLPFASGATRVESILEFIEELRDRTERAIDPAIMDVQSTWFCYQEGEWGPWTDRIAQGFPFLADVRDTANVAGADAAVLIETEMQRLTPGSPPDTITWSAAAKPFGALGEERPTRYGLVLPAFTDIRLIPVDTSSAPSRGSEAGWGIHIYEHLEPYLESGTDALVPGCYYCDQLRTWEPQPFRQQGLDWLETNSDRCQVPTGGGGGSGGGTRRGH